jgi:arylformamidase
MAKIIDISMVLDSDHRMHTPMGVKPFQFEIEVIKEHDALGGAGQLVRAIHSRVHSGCHIDAPEHYIKGGTQIYDIPLDTFIGPAIVTNMKHKAPGGVITAADLEADVGAHILKGDRLLINTGWNDNYGQPNYEEDSPTLSMDGVHWCVEKQLKIVGLDFAHIKDPPGSPWRYYITRYLLEHGTLTMPRICNLDKLSQRRVTLICLPLPIRGVEASMVRAVVLEE